MGTGSHFIVTSAFVGFDKRLGFLKRANRRKDGGERLSYFGKLE
jgi:hypothetical protein